jgi:DNA-binding CsgD family transcriptional regulator
MCYSVYRERRAHESFVTSSKIESNWRRRSAASPSPQIELIFCRALLDFFRGTCVQLAPRAAHEDFLAMVRDKLSQGPESRRIFGVLTRREAEIFSLLRRLASNKHLARAAHITEDAVKFHLKNISRKLGVHSRSEALAVLDARRPK